MLRSAENAGFFWRSWIRMMSQNTGTNTIGSITWTHQNHPGILVWFSRVLRLEQLGFALDIDVVGGQQLLRNELEEEAFAILQCVESCRGAGRYSLPHHSFQEYFCPSGSLCWCSCWSYPCQKRSGCSAQRLNLVVGCLQPRSASLRLRLAAPKPAGYRAHRENSSSASRACLGLPVG